LFKTIWRKILRFTSPTVGLLIIAICTEACFQNKLVPPELDIYQLAEKKHLTDSEVEFCDYIASVIDYQRAHTGRMTASAPHNVFLYAAECKDRGHLKSVKNSGLASNSEEHLLLRAALCGNHEALKLYKEKFGVELQPKFKLFEDSDGYYMKEVSAFEAPQHERFPYTSITGDSFCGYAETEFTTAGILLTPIVLIPTIVIGAPFVIVGGVVYVLSFGTINFFS
jgi:hypothetical protein